MVCYHPLKGFVLGTRENGKKDIKVCSYDVQYIFRHIDSETWYKSCDTFSASNYNMRYIYITDFIEIPCGQCIGCRLSYSRDWANRCMLESLYHDDCYFVTLTYSDEFLPESHYFDKDTGEQLTSYTLRKRDLQLFMKRLRKNYLFDNKIRFFACGEYGGKTQRPHYHLILFGLHLDDLKKYKTSSIGDVYYNSEFLDKCWQNKGYVVVGQCTWDSCAYVARYVMKKAKGKTASVYEDFGMSPEFVLMSRRPGIAYQYFLEHNGEIYGDDKIYLSTKKGGKTVKPPRYFDRLEEEFFPDILESVKNNRVECAMSIKDYKMLHSDLSYQDLLQIEENAKSNRLEKLKRNLI